MARILRIATEALATFGDRWCFDCQQATGVRVWVTTLVGETLKLHSQGRCLECGRPNVA